MKKRHITFADETAEETIPIYQCGLLSSGGFGMSIAYFTQPSVVRPWFFRCLFARFQSVMFTLFLFLGPMLGAVHAQGNRIGSIDPLEISLVGVPQGELNLARSEISFSDDFPGQDPNSRRSGGAASNQGRPARVPCTTRVTTLPISVSDHARCFAVTVFNWKTVAAPSLTAGIAQLSSSHDGFTSDWNGYGQHVGVNILGNVTTKFFGSFALPVIFHQDERIVRLGSSSKLQTRIVHVLTHVLITGSADHSAPVFNASALPGSAISAIFSNLYQPQQVRTVSATAERFGWNIGGYIAGDAYTEFQPDLQRGLMAIVRKVWPRNN
jgi:hypothetical protein